MRKNSVYNINDFYTGPNSLLVVLKTIEIGAEDSSVYGLSSTWYCKIWARANWS